MIFKDGANIGYVFKGLTALSLCDKIYTIPFWRSVMKGKKFLTWILSCVCLGALSFGAACGGNGGCAGGGNGATSGNSEISESSTADSSIESSSIADSSIVDSSIVDSSIESSSTEDS